ncbi:HYR domain-containing protein [Microcoleus sp. Pol11C3]|uniref:HYR domain-containing protein n=1 Tax=Microcoleus sp. Pol11C3 TaxID=3055390 RepID=UPI002FCEBC2B
MDNQNPVITNVPASFSATVGEGGCLALVGWPNATASDNCGIQSLSTNNAQYNQFGFALLSKGVHTIVYTAVDVNGRTSTASFTVTVTDDQAPVITGCPSTININTTPGQCTGVALWNPPTASDNCVGVTMTGTHVSGQTFPIGTTTVTYTATDASGLSTSCSFNVVVTDKQLPSITCAANVTVNNITNECKAVVSLTAPVTGDNCGVASVTNNHPSNEYPVGTTVVTWTVIDIHGNINTCDQTVTVVDAQAPVISCPGNISSIATSAAGVVINYTTPAGTDNCAGATTAMTTGLASGSTFPIGTTTVTYVVTDASGLTATCSFDVTVVGVPPVIVCPSDIIVSNTTGACGTNVSFAATETTAIPASTITYSHQPGSFFPVGTTTVTATATNAVGTSVCTFTITVNDTEAPVANVTNLPTITAECSASAPVPTATDNCSGVINGVPSGPTSFTTQGTHTITWTYTDAAGNASVQTQTVVIDDNTPPVIACPFDIVVNATTGTCGAVVNYSQPSATDNCGSGTLPTSIAGYTYKGTFGGHTYFVSNNQATPEAAHAASIALGGHLATISSAAENALISGFLPGQRMWIGFTDRDNEGTYKWITNEPITYTNWSGGEPNNAGGNEDWAVINWTGPTWNDWYYTQPAYYVVEFEGGNIPTTMVSGLASGSVFPVGTTVVTYSATDVGGNTVSCSFTVTVNDVEKPKLVNVPANATVECTSVPAAANVTATDNCPGVGAVNYTEVKADGNCAGNYTLTRTWSVTDAHGNSTSATQIVTVEDTKAPVMVKSATDATVQCDGAGNTAALTAWLASNGGASATDDCSNVNWSNNFTALSDGCGNTGSATVVFTATDDCGNASSTTATFTIVDNTAPSVTAAQNAVVECDGSGNTAALAAWLASNGGATASDVCSNVTWSNNFSALSDDCGNTGSATVVFTATDNCGNATSTTATFTIVDKTAPVISCPADVTLNCQDNSNPSATGSATATDVCSGVTITYSDVSTQNGNANNAGHYNYTITRTWTATDACNNSSSCVQVITVQDVTAPTAICKPVTITLVNGTASITTADINNNSTDNCSPMTYSLSKSTFSCSDIGANTVTLTVTDVSGNSSTCTATVNVVGEIPTCSVVSVPTSNVYTGGNVNNLYLGYGAQSTTLQLSVPASGAPYTFSWSGNGTLSSTTVQSPLFAPTAAGTYTFTVFITNKYGCTTTCTISICVTDIRVPSKNGTWDGKKVYVCHVPPGNPGNAHTLEISVNAVPSHIGPSGHATDRLGKCEVAPCTAPTYSKAPVTPEVKIAAEALTVKLSPNPTTNYFMLQVMSSDRKTPVTVRVMNALGKMIETQRGSVEDMYRFGNSYINGTYFVEVIQGENRKVVQGIKAN